MDLKRLTRMFLCDFHKKHILRVWKVGNLTSIDQIHLVNYLWFYNATEEEGTVKILKRKTILSLQLSVKIKDFWCWWVFEQYIGPITWFDHKKAMQWSGYPHIWYSLPHHDLTYNSTGKDNEKKWKDLRGPKKH